MIRLLLADDHDLIRSGFRVLLDGEPDLAVIGEARTGAEAVDRCRELRPDVVLMDIQMPGQDGIEATRRIRADPDLAEVKVIVLTTFELAEHVLHAVRAGADGFLGKGCAAVDLHHAVRAVAAGASLLSHRATRQLLDTVRDLPDTGLTPRPPLAALTTREQQVAELVAHGLSNQEIAERLFLSPLTVKSHVSHAMTKLGVRDRAQLVACYYRGSGTPRS
ncbi:response regulator [Crossiella sp. CA198]|uniref:response regulator n=1 Tax=Crossiella sp. CA198 TaxID=3455607 RepID=UPI003F8D821C